MKVLWVSMNGCVFKLPVSWHSLRYVTLSIYYFHVILQPSTNFESTAVLVNVYLSFFLQFLTSKENPIMLRAHRFLKTQTHPPHD